MVRNYSTFDPNTCTTTRFHYNEDTKEVLEETSEVDVLTQTEMPISVRKYIASEDQQTAFAFAETRFIHDENGNRVK